MGDAVVGNSLGGSENNIGTLANTSWNFSGSSDGFKNGLLGGRQRQPRSGIPHNLYVSKGIGVECSPQAFNCHDFLKAG